MLQNKIILLVVLLGLIVSSCIKPYDPKITGSDAKKYVVSGGIDDSDSNQIVNITMTSSISDPKYLPVAGCIVVIISDKGIEFPLTDIGDGDYSTVIDRGFMTPGASFMVDILSPSGERIISGYDTLTPCPKVDSIYYIREDIEGAEPGEFTLGIQFYVDFYGAMTDSRFYRLEVTETFEHHAVYPLEWYYDGEVHHVVPPDYSRFVCWTTNKIQKFFPFSTINLTENQFNKLPLQYVNNRSSRLMYGYSMLVKQYSLSDQAFIYFDQLSINNSQEGGLYETQPLAIRGNMMNLTNPENEVLGYFSVSSTNEKRIFVSNVPDLPLDFPTYCDLRVIRYPFKEFRPKDYPVFLLGDAGTWYPIQLNEECINCLKLGGTTVKPDFWPY
jgi:hypothetical protein